MPDGEASQDIGWRERTRSGPGLLRCWGVREIEILIRLVRLPQRMAALRCVERAMPQDLVDLARIERDIDLARQTVAAFRDSKSQPQPES